MLKEGTLLKVSKPFIATWERISTLPGGKRFDNRTRIQRNSMTEKDSDSDYDGFFLVSLKANDEGETANTLEIVNGFNAQEAFAGYAYYNLLKVACPVGTVQASEGYLLLGIDSEKKVTYTIESDIPDMPIMKSTTGENGIAKYPLAKINKIEEGESASWSIQQISRYEIPHLFCWGVCDENTGGESGGSA